MAWVRYDDGFYAHDKVSGLIAQGQLGIEAIGLHLLANTWSAQSRRPGFVPAHQPGVLIANVKRGAKLAGLLEGAGLWDVVEGGWEFHDAADYRASEKRQTPGTPADLSAKRAAAGRKGGKATQQTKQTGKQTVQQDEQDAEQPSSKPCSPVVASNEATPVPEPVPTMSGEVALAAPDVGALVAGFIEGCRERPPSSFVARIGKEVRSLVLEGIEADAIRGGLTIVAERGLAPTTLPSAIHEHLNRRPRAVGANNDTAAKLDAAMERARAAEAQQRRAL